MSVVWDNQKTVKRKRFLWFTTLYCFDLQRRLKKKKVCKKNPMAEPLQKGWLLFRGSLRHEKGASFNPKAVSGNSANKPCAMSFGVMPVLLMFMQFWIWVGSPLAASLHTASLDFSWESSSTTPSYWGIQVGHCYTWLSETPELGFPYQVHMSVLDLFIRMLCHCWEERQSSWRWPPRWYFFLLAVESAIVTNWDADLWV